MEEEIRVQVEDNLPSIEYTLRPIAYTSWFLGVGIARPRGCPKVVTVILRIVHFGVCSVIVAYGALDFFTFGSVFKSDIFKIMYYMNKVVCYVSAYYYVYHGIRQYDRWPQLMDKMKNLDQKIRREIPVNDRPVKNAQVLAILATFACGPLSLSIHALYYYFTLPEDIFASDLLLYYTIAQSLINSFVFDVTVYVLYRRFQMLNELIGQLDERFDAPWVALKVRRIRELHTGEYVRMCLNAIYHSISFSHQIRFVIFFRIFVQMMLRYLILLLLRSLWKILLSRHLRSGDHGKRYTWLASSTLLGELLHHGRSYVVQNLHGCR